MAYFPPGVPAPIRPEDFPEMGVGTHTCILADFTQASPSPRGLYHTAFVATYQNEKGEQIKDWIKFNGVPADYYAGLRIERLCAIFNAPVPEPGTPLDPAGMKAFGEGVEFVVEIVHNPGKDGRLFLNIKDVMAAGV